MTERKSIMVAAAQYPLDQLDSLEAWRRKILRWVEDGAETGAELLVFPEYAAIEQAATFGPDVSGDLEATLKAVANLTRERIAFHQELAVRYGVHILVGSGPAGKGNGQFVNAAQLVTPEGSAGVQEKLVMTPFERDWGIKPGHPIRVFDTQIGKIGIAICYDSEFPLLGRGMAEAGAEMILVPSCTERISGYHRVRIGARARALENQLVTVLSPTVGEAIWSPAVDHNTGAAGIYLPSEQMLAEDGILAEGAINKPQWVTAKIDLAGLRLLRSEGEMRNFADWDCQPGASCLSGKVDVVRL